MRIKDPSSISYAAGLIALVFFLGSISKGPDSMVCLLPFIVAAGLIALLSGLKAWMRVRSARALVGAILGGLDISLVLLNGLLMLYVKLLDLSS